MSDTWKNNWKQFIRDLSLCLQGGETTEQLAERFGGASVTWTGPLDEIRLDGLAPGVVIGLIEEIDIGEGRTAMLCGLCLRVEKRVTSVWRKYTVGDVVTFSANFVAQDACFPPVELETGGDDEYVITIRLTNAIPVA